MSIIITQRRAKVLIRDYLRETGRRGVTALMQEMRHHAGHEIFVQRTLEKWLEVQKRMLDEVHWEIVLSFIESAKFKSVVPYLHEENSDDRFAKVAEGLMALYASRKRSDGVLIFPSQIHSEGESAAKLLAGCWENEIDPKNKKPIHSLCKFEHVPGKRYAKVAYIALSKERNISASGIAIYLKSQVHPEFKYCHKYLLQLWRRQDPETGSLVHSELAYLTIGKKQPKLTVSAVINQYFYKEDKPDMEQRLVLGMAARPNRDALKIIDFLLEDVLPHGIT